MNPEFLEEMHHSYNKQNFLSMIGAKLEVLSKGHVRIHLDAREDLTQQHGMLHAGILTTIADVACGYSAMSTLESGYEVLSAEFKLHLLRGAKGKRFYADGKVIKQGRRLIISEAEIYDKDSEELIAKMIGTMIPIQESK